ncbi:MAG: aldehyde dehydrogenase family protein [Pseudomonadota bacterium]
MKDTLANAQNFYIDGAWVAPAQAKPFEVIDPANEEGCATISLGSKADVDRAVAAARRAFEPWAFDASLAQRTALVEKLLQVYNARSEDMAQAISLEMGAPIDMARSQQAPAGHWHIGGFLKALAEFPFEQPMPGGKNEMILHEPIGVCGLITPWNWPMNQVVLKVVPAVAVGCTVVLKPSEIAPLSSLLFAEIMDEAGFPAGVFNLVNGDGPGVGEAMSAHPDIDMMSLTGSGRAGIAVSKASADTIKRVTLELGGKGANLIFADTDVEAAVKRGVRHCMNNSGQSCNAPTRMMVEASVYDQAVEIAAAVAGKTAVGDPRESGRHIGPVVSEAQYNKIQGLIETGIQEGARLVAGGLGRPEGFNRGYYCRPTVFADVTNDMTIAREEIFGPVLSVMRFADEAEGLRLANDTSYGLTNYVQTGSAERGQRLARRLRAGMIRINGTDGAQGSPFGGFRQSGNGREGGAWGLHDFLEVKSVTGWA